MVIEPDIRRGEVQTGDGIERDVLLLVGGFERQVGNSIYFASPSGSRATLPRLRSAT